MKFVTLFALLSVAVAAVDPEYVLKRPQRYLRHELNNTIGLKSTKLFLASVSRTIYHQMAINFQSAHRILIKRTII